MRAGDDDRSGSGGASRVVAKEGGEFLTEDFPGRLFGEKDVIASGKRDETGTRNLCGEDAAFFRRSNTVAIGVTDDGRHGELGKERADIDGVAGAHEFDEIVGGDGHGLQIVKPALVVGTDAFRYVEVADNLKEGRVGLAPIELNQRFESVAYLDSIGAATMVCATRVTAAENEVADTLWMAYRVGNGDRASLRMAEEGEFIEPSGVDDGFEIVNPGFEGNIFHIPLGEAVAAAVVAKDAVGLGHVPNPVVPDSAFPLKIEMVEAIGHPDERMP